MPRARLLLAYAGGLAALAATLTVLAERGSDLTMDRATWLALPTLTVLVAIAERLLVRFRYRDEVDGLNLVEAILAPLLFAFPPVAAVCAVAVGQLVAAVVSRNNPVKAAFNVAQWSLAAAAGAGVLVLIHPDRQVTGGALLAVVGALGAVWLVNNTAFVAVLSIARGQGLSETLSGYRPVIVAGWLGAWAVNVLIGLLYLLAFSTHPAAVALFPVPLVVLYVAYRGHAAAVADRARLLGLHRAASVLAVPVDPTESIDGFLREVAACFDADGVELLLRAPVGLMVHRLSGGRDGGYDQLVVDDRTESLEAAIAVQPGPLHVTTDRRSPLAPLLGPAGRRECLSAPLRDDGVLVGALLVLDRSGVEGPIAGQLAVLDTLARETANVFAKGRLVQTMLEERVRHGHLAQKEATHRAILDQLHQAVMPRCPELAGAALAVSYAASDPASPTGGDLYDCHLLSDGTLHLAVVDVVGHGVEATKDALSVVHALRLLATDGTPLSGLIERADELITAQHPDLVATVVVARFDPATGALSVASGGHPPALVVSANGRVTQLSALGGPIGWPGAGSDDLASVSLEPGDSLVLYTDGLIEARKDILEGMESLVTFASAAARKDPDVMAAELLDKSLAGAVRRDDSLVLILRREPVAVLPSLTRWHLAPAATSAREARHALAGWLADRGLHSDAAILVVSELVTNASRAARSSVTVTASLISGAVQLEVADDGPGAPELVTRRAPNGGVAAPLERGRGLAIVRSVADRVAFMSTAEGLIVTTVVPVEPVVVAEPSAVLLPR